MAHLDHVDGVMVGRAAYQDPYGISTVDQRIYHDQRPRRSRQAVAEAMADYIDRAVLTGVPAKAITRHMMGLFNGLPGARAWRRHLSESARAPDATGDVVRRAANLIQSGDDPEPALQCSQRHVQ